MYTQLFTQITHLGDFKYWRIFHGLTVEQIREREELCEYPPRLQIKCKPIDATKPLYFAFMISKRSKSKEIAIAQFLLDNIAQGTNTINYKSFVVIDT